MTQESILRRLGIRLVTTAMAGTVALGATMAVTAQDADTVRPAAIHAGTCDGPGDVVAELRPLTVTFDDDDADDGGGSGTGGAAQPTPAGTGGNDDADDSGGGDDGTSGGDDDADDGGTGGGDDNSGGGDDDADDDGTGGDDGADDGGDDDADDSGSRLTGVNALRGTDSAIAMQTAGGQFVGAEDASAVEGSEDSDVGVGLDALLAAPHIVAVFESEGSGTIIACGSIGGFTSGDDDDLAVGLREQNGSGFAGIAILDDDDDDNELDADVYIAREVVSGGGV